MQRCTNLGSGLSTCRTELLDTELYSLPSLYIGRECEDIMASSRHSRAWLDFVTDQSSFDDLIVAWLEHKQLFTVRGNLAGQGWGVKLSKACNSSGKWCPCRQQQGDCRKLKGMFNRASELGLISGHCRFRPLQEHILRSEFNATVDAPFNHFVDQLVQRFPLAPRLHGASSLGVNSRLQSRQSKLGFPQLDQGKGDPHCSRQ